MSLFRKLGELAGPKVRKAKWMWQSLTGDENDILRAEAEVGEDLAAAMRQAMGVDDDRVLSEGVGAIGAKLSRCVADRRRTFTFTVTAEGEANAFALPGGHVFITRALIELMGRGVDEIACVLGHEMAHVIKQDPMERIMSDATIGAALRAVRVAGPAGQWLSQTSRQLLTSAYSQDRELFADRLGARLAHEAGYSAWAAVRMLARLESLHEARPELPLAEYFATHPPLKTRIAELGRYLKAMKIG